MSKKKFGLAAAAIGAIAIIIGAIISIIPDLLDTAPVERNEIPENPVNQVASPQRDFHFPFRIEAYFQPTGWMGDAAINARVDGSDVAYVSVTDVAVELAGKNETAMRIEYRSGPQKWAGIYWQYPENNWGDLEGYDLSGIQRITFLARGEVGDELVEFKSGGIGGRYRDSFERSLGKQVLTTEWKLFTIELGSEDTSNTVGAFAWVAPAPDTNRPLVFYVASLIAE